MFLRNKVIGSDNYASGKGLNVFGQKDWVGISGSGSFAYTIPKACKIQVFVISVVDANYYPRVKIYHNSTIVSSGSTTNRGGLAYATLDVNQNDTIFINYSSDGGTESISLLIYEIPDTAIDIVDTTAANTTYTAPSDGYLQFEHEIELIICKVFDKIKEYKEGLNEIT